MLKPKIELADLQQRGLRLGDRTHINREGRSPKGYKSVYAPKSYIYILRLSSETSPRAALSRRRKKEKKKEIVKCKSSAAIMNQVQICTKREHFCVPKRHTCVLWAVHYVLHEKINIYIIPDPPHLLFFSFISVQLSKVLGFLHIIIIYHISYIRKDICVNVCGMLHATSHLTAIGLSSCKGLETRDSGAERGHLEPGGIFRM